MNEMKLIWHNDGKHDGDSHRVSVRENLGDYLCDVCSPTDIVGTGSDFGSARERFAEMLDEYIAALIKFRDEVVETSRAYYEAVETDFAGNPLRTLK